MFAALTVMSVAAVVFTAACHCPRYADGTRVPRCRRSFVGDLCSLCGHTY